MQHAAAFQACFTDWRLIKGRKVVQVVLEVPLEVADEAYRALGGMPDPGKSVWCAVARLQEQQPDKPVKPRAKVSTEKRLAQQAGILCSDPVFQKFMVEEGKAYSAEDVPEAVRIYCGVTSRSEIIPGTSAATKWDILYGRFIAWRDAPEMVA